MWVGLLVVVVAVVMFFVGKTMTSAPPPQEKKRFGLDQAEAAMKYMRDAGPGAAKAVLGVVVGVLGFENAVATDGANQIADLADSNDRHAGRIDDHNDEIAQLRAQIGELQGRIDGNNTRADEVRGVVEAFSV